MIFYLGTHHTHWLRKLAVPLFVSRRRLVGRKTLPRARERWALDSGAFSELQIHGRWSITAKEYASDVFRFRDEIGKLDWAAPQDWMCEPFMLRETGLSLEEHQRRTVDNYLELLSLGVPVIPVLQGFSLDEYFRCVKLYEDNGIDLSLEPVVGIGSVCRRQRMREANNIISALNRHIPRLHGFGVKTTGLGMFAEKLVSADSMAWSFYARRRGKIDIPGKTHNCSNCRWFALAWRMKCLSIIESRISRAESEMEQLDFGFHMM